MHSVAKKRAPVRKPPAISTAPVVNALPVLQAQVPQQFYALPQTQLKSTTALSANVAVTQDVDASALLTLDDSCGTDTDTEASDISLDSVEESRVQQANRQPLASPTGLPPLNAFHSPSPLAKMLSNSAHKSPLGKESKKRSVTMPPITHMLDPPLGPNQLAIYFEDLHPTILSITGTNADVSAFRSCALFENPMSRLPSSHRLLLYPNQPDITMQVRVDSVSRDVQAFLRECICLSTIIVVSPYKRASAFVDEPVLLMLVEFPLAQDLFQIDGHITTLRNIKSQAKHHLWNNMFPLARLPVPSLDVSVASSAPLLSAPHTTSARTSPLSPAAEHDEEPQRTQSPDSSSQCATTRSSSSGAPESDSSMSTESPNEQHEQVEPLINYHPSAHRTFVLLDLDKTLFLSDADARDDQRYAFVGDFEIAGNMAITNERFAHRMMLRPGVHWFLRRLLAIAEVFVITAGDLHYARNAVQQANQRNWVSSKDPTTDFESDIASVHIPLTRVFSVRNHAKRALPKTLERALPFASHMNDAGSVVLAVDDDPGAWDLSCRHHVIPVSPFQPLNNSPDCLLHVAWLIEQASAQYFYSLHAYLPTSEVSADHLCALSGMHPDGRCIDESQPVARTDETPVTPSAVVKLDKRIRSVVKALKIVDVVLALVTSMQ